MNNIFFVFRGEVLKFMTPSEKPITFSKYIYLEILISVGTQHDDRNIASVYFRKYGGTQHMNGKRVLKTKVDLP